MEVSIGKLSNYMISMVDFPVFSAAMNPWAEVPPLHS